MSKNFDYILSKLKLDGMTFCSMKSNNFYERRFGGYKFFFSHRRVAANACCFMYAVPCIHCFMYTVACIYCFMYAVACIHCFNRIVQFLVRINKLLLFKHDV